MNKKRDHAELPLLELEDGPEAGLAPPEIDVAESYWDPWLIALARMEVQGEARPN